MEEERKETLSLSRTLGLVRITSFRAGLCECVRLQPSDARTGVCVRLPPTTTSPTHPLTPENRCVVVSE